MRENLCFKTIFPRDRKAGSIYQFESGSQRKA